MTADDADVVDLRERLTQGVEQIRRWNHAGSVRPAK
jgi:hypothetical protein